MNQTVFANLVAEDIDGTIAWYQDNLRAELKMKTEGDRAGFATLIVAGSDVMFQTAANIEKKYPRLAGRVTAGQGVALNIQVDDAQAVYDGLDDTSGVIAEPADTFYGMREFTIQDPNGYLLTVASVLARAQAESSSGTELDRNVRGNS